MRNKDLGWEQNKYLFFFARDLIPDVLVSYSCNGVAGAGHLHSAKMTFLVAPVGALFSDFGCAGGHFLSARPALDYCAFHAAARTLQILSLQQDFGF